MRFVTRKVDPFHDEDAAEDIRILDTLCFDATDSKIELDKGYWWIVYHGKEAVAYGAVRQSVKWVGWGYLCRAGVAPKYRGHGLQRRLIAVRLRFARGRGWHGLLTDTSCDNIASANNLIVAGFKMFRPTKPWSFASANYWLINLEADHE